MIGMRIRLIRSGDDYTVISAPYAHPVTDRTVVDIELDGATLASERGWTAWPLSDRGWQVIGPGPPDDLEARV